MNHFRSFEAEALRLLGAASLGDEVVSAVIRDAEFVGLKHSGVGYFLTVRHPLLPSARLVLSQPIVVGSVGGVSGSYLAFIGQNELMLEYAGTTDVPSNFRDLPVQVQVHANVA
jgi:hypothetical protein